MKRLVLIGFIVQRCLEVMNQNTAIVVDNFIAEDEISEVEMVLFSIDDEAFR